MPDRDDLRADITNSARRLQGKPPRRQNNPFIAEPALRPGITYKDDTGNTAVGNVMREQRGKP